MSRRTNREILSVARQSIEAVAEVVRAAERSPGVRELAHHLVASDDRHVPERLRYPYTYPSHPSHQKMMASTRDVAIFRLWGRAKVVYAMDDLLLAYLSQSSATAIPTGVFESLPHPNPYILLPRPDFTDEQTTYFRGHIGIPWGAFVFGRYNQSQQLCSTQDDRREDLGLMFVGFLDTATGPVLQTLRCTMPLRERMTTVESSVNETVAKFVFNEELAEGNPAMLEVWLRTYVAQVFNSLLYVCTDRADVTVYRPHIDRAGKIKKRHKRQRSRMSDVEMFVQIGFRLGPALRRGHQQSERRARQEAPAGAGQRSPGSRQRPRPHRRGPHYQTYWTGPGRSVPRLKLIAPYWVNTELLDEAGPKDVVVRPVRRRPE